MKMFRDMLKYRRRLAMGFQVAMAMFAHTKGAASTAVKAPEPKQKNPADQTSRYDFSKLVALASNPGLVQGQEPAAGQPDRRRDLASMVDATWKLAESQTTAADSANFTPQPMNREEARLWLQAYNAGPYALLKYRGNVPYRETQNYAPRVFKYYMENLANNEFDPFIQESAKKYGLDPQFIRAIIKTESDFSNSCVSGAGASGLCQVMPAVWSEVKKKYSLDWDYGTGVFEPQKNIEVACAYLAWLRYDFLPRHFAEFEPNPEAPTILVRDKDRGVPDRQGPRIETAIAAAQSGPALQPIGNVAAAAAALAPKLTAPKPAQAPALAPAKPATTVASVAKPKAPLVTKKVESGKSATATSASAKPEKITVELAQASSRKTQTQTKAGKTIVSMRGTGSKMTKQPSLAGSDTDKSVASVSSKATKPNPRSLKKPSVAQADNARDEERRS
jgi:soluble lytic murein transglycosylase-like protein